MSRGRAVWLVTLLVAVQYGNAVDNGYVLDDQRAILDNSCVTGTPGVSCAFSHDFWGRPGHQVGRTYRPLVVLSFAVDWAVGGGAPWVFHLTNVVLHLLACLALLWFLRVLVPDRAGPTAAAAVFAVLAVHTEAVTGLVGRADLVATIFACLALGSHLRWCRTGRPAWLAAAAALLGAALLSHEVAVLVPVVALVCDWAVDRLAGHRGRRAAGYVALGAVVLGYLVLRLVVLGRIVGPPPAFLNNPVVDASAWGRVLFACASVSRSLAVVAFPFTLSAEYGHAAVSVPSTAANLGVIVGVGLTLALVLGLVAAARRAPLVATGCGTLLFGLALLSNGPVIMPTAFAERLLYLPSVGLALLLGGLYPLLSRIDRRWLTAGLGLAVLLLNLVLGMRRNRDWRDSIDLFTSAASAQPLSVRAQLNLGLALNRAGRHGEAIPPLGRALRIYPRLPVAAAELAMAYDLTGDPVRARRWFESAYRAAPENPHVKTNFVRFLRRHGLQGRARQVQRRLPTGPAPCGGPSSAR